VALYFCLGFRQVAETLLALAEALRGGEPARVRERLADLGCAAPAAAETARKAMETGLRRCLDRLFGGLFWFVLFGPAGAVLYALSRLLGELWRGDTEFHAAVERVVFLLDWLPARLLAFSFAVVGNFDDAMLGWRGRLDTSLPPNEAVVVAAGFGALGLNDIKPGPEYLSGVVSLAARAILLWLAVLGLLWLGGL
jgi:membrane protein required for beta-lactamase induction